MGPPQQCAEVMLLNNVHCSTFRRPTACATAKELLTYEHSHKKMYTRNLHRASSAGGLRRRTSGVRRSRIPRHKITFPWQPRNGRATTDSTHERGRRTHVYIMWMVAAKHKKCAGPIDSYDSLNDEHLRPHFHKSLVRQRLARVGLVRCLRHDGNPNVDDPDSRRCTCSLSGSRVSPDTTSTTSSGDSGVVVGSRNADLTCATCRGGSSTSVAPPPKALISEPVSPYLLPVNPSSKRKLVMPRPSQPAAGSRSTLRRASITPSTPTSFREELGITKNHFPKKSDCRVSLLFRGSGSRITEAHQSVIRVTQQHCGGTSLTVFAGQVTPGETFTFASRRHCGYPFSIVIFLNDIRDVQLSSCCEYRYNVGTRLGGSQGRFSLAKLEGGNPCYRCMLEKRLKELPTEEHTPFPGSTPKESSGLSSPITSSSETVDGFEQSVDDGGTNSVVSSEEEHSISDDERRSPSQESSEPTQDEIADAAEKELYSNETNYSSETFDAQSQLPTSESEYVGEQIEGDAASSSHDSTQVSNERHESGTISNSFESYSSTDNSGDKSAHSETGSHVADEVDYNIRHNVAQPSVYFVQDKKKQWGSDECRGESFSSDDDAQTVTLTVKAEVHSTQ
ncbi:hypothetical protein HPB51_013313 [Rhipicephalus microplus]|uniref:DUF4590 domain-containing protein n=1 Tax=Rhipicephalus microplus TaxID=6941 RepID=A0A9J6DGA3_RHIMP|nr:hypothetical protein HPB51_013313 [Rhipicephalus microplus]